MFNITIGNNYFRYTYIFIYFSHAGIVNIIHQRIRSIGNSSYLIYRIRCLVFSTFLPSCTRANYLAWLVKRILLYLFKSSQEVVDERSKKKKKPNPQIKWHVAVNIDPLCAYVRWHHTHGAPSSSSSSSYFVPARSFLYTRTLVVPLSRMCFFFFILWIRKHIKWFNAFGDKVYSICLWEKFLLVCVCVCFFNVFHLSHWAN